MSTTQKKIYRIGTRKSALAWTQTTGVAVALKALGIECELVPIESSGDQNRDLPLYQMNQSPGLFTKQLEQALLENVVDLAVHSLKDLPTVQPKGLQISAIPKRAQPEDCLVVHPTAHDPQAPLEIQPETIVGTSSLRREALLIQQQPKLKIQAIRGNVPTRIDKVRQGKVGAVVLAEAGLRRLNASLEGLLHIPLPVGKFVPAPGQGALAIETRTDIPSTLKSALAELHHSKSAQHTWVEREILRQLEGGCSLPLGAYCSESEAKQLNVKTFLGIPHSNKTATRSWAHFGNFDFCGDDPQNLVAQSVNHLMRVQKQGF